MRVQLATGVSLSGVVSGAGADVVFLHGWMMAGAVFDPLLDRLPATGRRVHQLDLRGAGASDKPATDYSLATYVADIVAWLDHHGIERATVVGHSMGGQLAQLLAATVPDRVDRLVLLNPVPAAGLPLPSEARALFRASAGDRESQGAILDMACTQLTPAERARLLDIAATVSESCIQESLDAWTAGGFADLLGRIAASTHVVATSDPFLPAQLLQQAVVDPIPGASLHLLEGPGHYALVEAPDRAAALVHELLDR